jgi:hypothetical protein
MNKRFLTVSIAGLFLFSVSAWAQISMVGILPCQGAFPATTCSINATGSGHLIVVGWASAGGSSPTISSVTDNAGNTYVEAGSARAVNTAQNRMVDIWYAKNSNAGATTVTITPNPAGSSGAAVVWEFAGVDTTAPLDRTVTLNTQPATTTPTTAAITTTSAGELIISTMIPSTFNNGLVAGSLFSNDQSEGGVGWAHYVAPSIGTYSAQYSTLSGTYASSSVSFKVAGATGGGPTSACDLVTPFGTVDTADVAAAQNMALGIAPCTATVAVPQVCNVVVVQRVVNAMPPPNGTGNCLAGLGAVAHAATLTWTASPTTNVKYNVYRASSPGGYTTSPLATVPAGTITYVDASVLAGQTYYYVVRAVDPNNSSNVSAPTNEMTANIPTP